MSQLKTIQVLRALAALAVMLAHLHGIEARQSGEVPLMSSVWLAGVSGVDLFFVISGFIMVWVAGDWQAGPTSAGKFLFARMTRIYPLWWLFAGAMAVYFFLTYGTPWDQDMLTRVGVGGGNHLVYSFLLIPHEAFPVLTLGWTLIHEMYFYCVFALILLLPRRQRAAAFAIWGFIILASISAQMTGFYANSLLSLALFPMTLEFLMGAVVGWMVKAGWHRLAWPCLVIGLIWLGFALQTVNFTSTDALLPTERTFAYGPAFALILYALVTFEQRSGLGRFMPTVLVRIGDWSYALYLSHLLVISAVARLFFPLAGMEGYADNAAFLILGSAIAITVSGLTYTLFEKPILNASRKVRAKLFKSKPTATAPTPAN